MDATRLQDRIDRGLGAAARHAGIPYDAFRPAGTSCPLAPANRFLRLPAAFFPQTGSGRPMGYGQSVWSGVFDTAYTRIGDYLRGPAGTFFVVAQQPLLPPLCVLATRTLSVSRPSAPAAAGVNGYGGLLSSTATSVLTDWPASVLFAGAGGPGDLPGDAGTPSWNVLLPPTPVPLRGADVIADDMGRSYTIGSAELTALGWRILAKQAAT